MNKDHKSARQSNPSRLCFNSQDDTLSHIEQSVEHWNNWEARQNSGTIEGYINGRCEVVLRFALTSEHLDFIFRAIPVDIGGGFNTPGFCMDGDIAVTTNDGTDQCVFIPVAHVVQLPENDVPSFVRVEFPKARTNLLRNRGTAIHGIVEINPSLSEGECTGSVFGSHMPISQGTSVDGMIQSGPKIIDDIANNRGDVSVWHGFGQSEFVHFVSGLNVWLDDYFVRATALKIPNLDYEFIEVMLCPCDFNVRTLKWV